MRYNINWHWHWHWHWQKQTCNTNASRPYAMACILGVFLGFCVLFHFNCHPITWPMAISIYVRLGVMCSNFVAWTTVRARAFLVCWRRFIWYTTLEARDRASYSLWAFTWCADARCSIDSNGLTIRNITQRDNGEYICRAEVISIGLYAERRITVAVHS